MGGRDTLGGWKWTTQFLCMIQRTRCHAAQQYGWKSKENSNGSNLDREMKAGPRLEVPLKEGIVLIGSDLHRWPGPMSTSFKALLKLTTILRPKIIVMNGDLFDGAGISRHPAIGWEKFPTVAEQIEAVQSDLEQLEGKAPDDCELVWPLGNHDMRFESYLAKNAPEYEKVHGVHLKDHFSKRWRPCWSVDIGKQLIVKHRMKGGVHAAYNNAVASGRSVACGHDHRLGVRAYTDYNGTRFGISTGMLTSPRGPQFSDWTEDNPTDWLEGFIVCTFKGGKMMWPEVCSVVEPGVVQFRGESLGV